MISTWLLLCLLAARASGRPGFAWRLEVGCDINGFFVELLGLLPALDAIIPGGVVVRGLRCDERELAKLFPEEAAAVHDLRHRWVVLTRRCSHECGSLLRKELRELSLVASKAADDDATGNYGFERGQQA